MEVVVDAYVGEAHDAPGDDVGKEDADGCGDQAQDGELDGEDGGDACACGAECLEHDDLTDTAVARAGDGAGEDDYSGKDAERGEELHDVDDVEHDLANGLESGGDVDDGDGGIGGVEGALQVVPTAAGVAWMPPYQTAGRPARSREGRMKSTRLEGVLAVVVDERGDGGGELLVLCGKGNG